MKTRSVKFTVGHAVAVMGALDRALGQVRQSTGVPTMHRFLLLTSFKTLMGRPRVMAADQTRMELAKQYGTADESGNIRVVGEAFEKFKGAYKEVADESITIKMPILPLEILESLPPTVDFQDVELVGLLLSEEDVTIPQDDPGATDPKE